MMSTKNDLIGSITQFSYSKKDLFEREISFVEHAVNRFDIAESGASKVLIMDFFRYNDQIKSGICNELVYAAAHQLSDVYDGFIYYGLGQEPLFFSSLDEDQHRVLILSQKQLIEPGAEINVNNGDKTLNKLLKNTILYDPSFKKVRSFKRSKYNIVQLQDVALPINFDTTLTIPSEKQIPLELTKDNQIIYLGYSDQVPCRLGIGLQEAGKPVSMWLITSKSLDSLAKEVPEIGEYREYFMQHWGKRVKRKSGQGYFFLL